MEKLDLQQQLAQALEEAEYYKHKYWESQKVVSDHWQSIQKLPARVKVLEVENLALRESLDTVEAERDALQQQVIALSADLARLKAREPVAWMTTRENDASFPRLHKEECQADYWVNYCDIPPAIIKHELFIRLAPAADMAAQLRQPKEKDHE